MKFNKISVKNFKGLTNADINLGDSSVPVCILGLNESGKTTTLEAIKTLGELCRGKKLENGERNKIRPKGSFFSGEIILSAEVSLGNEDKELLNNDYRCSGVIAKFVESTLKKFEIEFKFKLKDAKFVSDDSKISFSNRKDSKNRLRSKEKKILEDKLRELLKDKAPDIIYYENFIFNIPAQINFKNPSDLDEEWQKILNDIYQQAAEQTAGSDGNDRDISEGIVNWDKAQGADVPEGRVMSMGKVLNEKITEKWHKYVAKDRNSFKEIKVSYNEMSKSFSIKIQSDESVYEVAERSKGFRWFFAFLIYTEFRKLRSKNTIFLLDEPASNLHSSAQEEVLKSLSDICSDAQVIYTTHSPYLIESKNADQLFLAKNLAGEYQNPSITVRSISDELKSLGESQDSIEKIEAYIRPLLDHIAYSQPALIKGSGNEKLPADKEEFDRGKLQSSRDDTEKKVKEELVDLRPQKLERVLGNIYYVIKITAEIARWYASQPL